MRPEVQMEIKEEEVLFFGRFAIGEELAYLATVPLSDSLEIISKKTALLLDGLMNIAGVEAPQYLIHNLLDSKGQLKDLKMQTLDKGRKRWLYSDPQKIKRSRTYDTGTSSIDVTYYTQKLLFRYGIPEDHCTAILVRALVSNLTKC